MVVVLADGLVGGGPVGHGYGSGAFNVVSSPRERGALQPSRSHRMIVASGKLSAVAHDSRCEGANSGDLKVPTIYVARS